MIRFFDLLFSFFLLILLFPLLLLVCIWNVLTGEHEIFYKQTRIGKNGKQFEIIKFATMLKNSSELGAGGFTEFNDSRFLPLGSFMRKTKINELPQLLNIFFGNMSVIGPRPLTTQTFGAYSENTQNLIKQVRPGLSGVGSIVFRGEEEIMHGSTASVDFYANVIAPYKGALEEWFVSNKSLYIYFVAIFVTAWAVLVPSTKIAWRVFKDLPEPPTELKQALNYTD